jgi:subtilisin-like proprotein convertase family protein
MIVVMVCVAILALAYSPVEARWRMTSTHGFDIRRVCRDGIQIGITNIAPTWSLQFVNADTGVPVLNAGSIRLPYYPDFLAMKSPYPGYYSGYTTLYWARSLLRPGTSLHFWEGFKFGVEDCSITDFHGSTARMRIPQFRVAYVYGPNTYLRDNYQHLLADNGYGVALVPLAAAATFPFSTVQAILIADDTDSSFGWAGTDAAVDNIRNAGKPVVGIGLGGSRFFDREGLDIGRSHAETSGGDTEIERVDSSNPIWENTGGTYMYVDTDNKSLAIRNSTSTISVTQIGRRVGSPDLYPLIGQLYNGTCHIYWGWRAAPDKLYAQQLFLNTFSTLACKGDYSRLPGPSTIRSTITVPDDAIIRDLDVALNIEHTWDADLQVGLTSPAGKTIRLFSGIGGGDNGIGVGCSHWAEYSGTNGSYKSLVLDDEATTNIVTATAPFTGAPAYRPQAPARLSAFDGQNAKGTWTLTVTDTYPLADNGILNCWSLQVTTSRTFFPVTVRRP